MEIIKYTNFINESVSDDNKDIVLVMSELVKLPTKDILEFRNAIKKSEIINESIFSDLKLRFNRWLTDITWKRIINKKKEFYENLVERMNIFDLTTLDDIVKNFPGFKLNGIYLAGGMDRAVDVGAGWRNEIEFEFEKYRRNNEIAEKHEIISFGLLGELKPCRVIEGENLAEYLLHPKKISALYDKPVILNPGRKEVDRTKNADFAAGAIKYKTFNQFTEPEEYEPTMTHIRKTLSKSIEPDDEHLVRITDATLLGLNTAAASGTFGELETLSYMNKPIFVWMTDKDWEFEKFSMWTFPHICKLARNEEEMKILVKTLVDFSKK